MAAAAVALQVAIGHGAALAGGTGVAAGLAHGLHLLAGGAWLGGLLPLFLAMRLPETAAAMAARRFSPLGIAAVAVLAVSALVQSWFLIASIPGLIGTPYGWLCLAKGLLFLLLLGLAALNRRRLTPKLAQPASAAAATRWLRRSIAAEILLGLGVLGAAGLLATATPAVHAEPWWPLPFRLSRAALQIPELYLEAYVSGYATALGLVLVLVGLPYRRLRWLAMPSGILLALFFSPGLQLFAVEATPTSFQTSPTGFAASSVLHGKALFGQHCVACHGRQGRGNGPAAAGLAIKPADLTADHLFDHPEGDLYWWISNGMSNGAMPGFAGVLAPEDRWQVIDFLHANAASTRLWDGSFLRPVPAPDLPISCPPGLSRAGGGPIMLSDLAGRAVHLVFVDPATPARLTGLAQLAPALQRSGAVSVVVSSPVAAVPAGLCRAESPEAAAAYAEIAGITAEAMPGAEFLIDPARLVRQVWLPADDPSSAGAAVLLGRIQRLRSAPAAAGAVAPHIH